MQSATAFAASPGSHASHAAHRFSGAGLAGVVAAHIAAVGVLVASHTVLPERALLATRLVQVITFPAPAPAANATPHRQRPSPVLAPDRATPAPTPAIPAMTAAAVAKDPAPAAPAPSESPSAPASQVVQAPRFDVDYLHNPAPVYPSLARRLGESGRVLLRVWVEPSGHASQIQVQTASGSSRLDQAAQDAVWRWKFVPAHQGDEAVGAWVLVPLVFSLKG